MDGFIVFMGINLDLTCIAVQFFPFFVALGRCTTNHPAIVCLLFQNQDSLEAVVTLQLVVDFTSDNFADKYNYL